ncbi:MAG: cytochrome c biogenesis protein CcdA [Hyphomicrobiales bacterium]
MDISFQALIVLPVALGLLGFIEPCSMGANLVYLKTLEGRPRATRLSSVILFVVIRAVTIGFIGILAALAGQAFTGAQKGLWLVFGTVYLLIGILYVTGRSGLIMKSLGPSLARLSDTRGSVGLAVLFGLNIPACSAPLLFVLFGAAAGAATISVGFVTMGLFGLALSLPLLAAVTIPAMQRFFEKITGFSRKLPVWTGSLFIVLGLWSVYFGLFVNLADWTFQS